jgi:trans-aconitate 2-methyltransferase
MAGDILSYRAATARRRSAIGPFVATDWRHRLVREWNAETYHRVSNPQFQWGLAVLERLRLDGHELVIDVGCGTGRLTARLLARLPRGRVVGVDPSSNMVGVAARELASHAAARAHVVVADGAALPMAGVADAIFSTATFHWVRDHDALFRSLFTALRPGGRLVAQCGGMHNLDRVRDRCAGLMRRAEFAAYFGTWRWPWEYAAADVTARRLATAGFEEIETSIEDSPVVLPDAAAFHEFVTNVIARTYVAHLPEAAPQRAFVDALTAEAARDEPPFLLDYKRLNISARKPART